MRKIHITLAKVATLSGGAAFVLGAAGLAGWITGLRTLASFRPEYVPMAPDTGLLLMALGAILFSGACKKDRGPGRSISAIFAGLASIYGVLKAVETLFKIDLTFQRILFPDIERLGAIVLGRMSPVTGILFFLSGIALLVCLLCRARRLPCEMAGGLGVVVLVAGSVAVTGYLFGTPLLYGGATVPLAANTAAAFIFLGLGLTVAAGKDSVPMRELSGPSASARLLRGILPIIVLAILLQGLLDTRLARVFKVNQALLSAILMLALLTVTVVIVVRITASVFRSAELAEAERRGAEEQLLIKGFALESSMSAIGLADMEGKIIYVNAAYVKLWGYDSKTEILGKSISEFALSTEWVREAVETMNSGREYVGEGMSRKKDGTEFAIMLSTNLVTSPEGRPICMMASINDITARKRAEEALRDSVKQTEILMKELQHRVKNSLAVVSGLLALGQEAVTDVRARGIIAETRSRIRSVAALYEQLYGTDDPVSVDLGRYIQRLAETLFKTYVAGSGKIVWKTRLDEIKLDTKRTVPVGLILNELVTNSLKYAYLGGATREIRIDLGRSGDAITLEVADDGPGLPEGFDPKASGSMGWSLIRMLAEEIGAELTCPPGGKGARVLIRFTL